jgi:4-amino-4-deoxy-L-arabinose transferase-like glycosyltransferase
VRRALPVAVFLILAFLFRLPILHRSVLDWDESVYFLMARAWLAGHLPYTTIWDNKPPGIYAIFVLFQSVIPGVQAMRIAATVYVAILAWGVSEITAHLSASRAAGWVSGCLVILCMLSNDGLSSNTEPFMSCFIVLAVLAVLGNAPAWLAGLLLGCGFMVKYVCAPEILVVLALLWHRHRAVRPVIEAMLAASIPLLATTLLYAGAGKLPLWWECGVKANFRRATVPFSGFQLWVAIKEQAERWGTLYLSGAWVVLRARKLSTPLWFLPAWLFATLIGALGAKSFYDHYFLEMLPPLCIAAGLIFAKLPGQWAPRALFLLILISLPAQAGWIALSQASGPDPQRIVARYLRAAGANSLYVFDGQPILYALTNLPPPTYYIFPSELVGNSLAKVAGVNPVQEVGRILATRPEYIIRHSWPRDPTKTNAEVYAEMDNALAAHYMLWRHVKGIDVYKLK